MGTASRSGLSIAFFLLPPTLLRPLARVAWLRRGLSFLLEPRASFAVWAGSLGAWHVPQAYDAALAHPAHYAAVSDRPFGLTLATDQTRAGLLMMAEQIATLGPAAALLLWSHVERVERELRAIG